MDSPLVLVADDVEDNRFLYAEYLAYRGYRVETAVNGIEAVEKARAMLPAAIVMDLSMPVMDGWQATRLLKGHPSTSGIWIVAVTGHTTPNLLDDARKAGADEVVKKPIEPKMLACLVAKGTNRRVGVHLDEAQAAER